MPTHCREYGFPLTIAALDAEYADGVSRDRATALELQMAISQPFPRLSDNLHAALPEPMTAGKLDLAYGLRRVRLTKLRAGWPTALAAAVGLVLASYASWLVETRITDSILGQVENRALDQVRMVVLERVAAEDFDAPFTPEKLRDLQHRLDPLMARVRAGGSNVIRLHLHARDGTIIYSDEPSLLGVTIPPDELPILAATLSGQTVTRLSDLSDPDDSDLKPRYERAIEVHVPVAIDNQVVGAYQMYQDVSVLNRLRGIAWGVAAAVFVLILAVTLSVAAYLRARARRSGSEPERGVLSPSVRAVPVQPSGKHLLTRREHEVLALMATSSTYREIAARLVLSEETVRSHTKNILHKLGQHDRAGAVIAAMQAGLLQVN